MDSDDERNPLDLNLERQKLGRQHTVKGTFSPGDDAHRRACPGWRAWAWACGALMVLVGAFYAALAASQEFVTAHAGAAAWGLICFVAGSGVAKVFYRDGKWLRPSWSDLCALLPATAVVVCLALFLMVWIEGDSLVAKENKLCVDMLAKQPGFEKSGSELSILEEERMSRWLPTRPLGPACNVVMAPVRR